MIKTATKTPFERVLDAFPDAREVGNYHWYSAKCTGHDDTSASLSFRENEHGGVSFKCHAQGCSKDAILSGAKLKPSDLYTDGYRPSYMARPKLELIDLGADKLIPWQFLMNEGVEDGYKWHGQLNVKITYYQANGKEHSKVRVRNKIGGNGGSWWDEHTPGKMIPYGLNKLDMARDSRYLLIGEGESDAWTCWLYGIPYLGVPGANNTQCLYGKTLEDIPHIYIIQEPDEAGEEFYKRVHKQLRATRYTGNISCLPFKELTGHKDPNALHKHLKGSATFKDVIQQAVEQAIPSNEPDLCLFDADDSGNGDAMFALYGDDFLYCSSFGWLAYNGTHWQLDIDGNEVKKQAVETLRTRRHAAVDAKREDIVKCTVANDRPVNGCINRFKTLVSVSIEEFDSNPDMLNCQNGVIDLRTGELIKHTRKQRFTYCLPVPYEEKTDYTHWTECLNDLVGGGQEVIDYLQMAIGYSLTGHTREEILHYLHGPTRSGKGTLAETLMALLPHPISTMVDFMSFTAKREGDVSNFDLAPLKPARIIFASESNKSQALNPAKIKQLTGGDLIRACYKHKDFFAYRPQFKVWMLSNHPVNGDPEDDALWGRVRVIPFPNSFLGKEDKTKKAALKEPEQLKGVLCWAVEGAIQWYGLGAKGLTTPKAIADITLAQRSELDYVQQWLDECTDAPEDYWTANDAIATSYTTWCDNNNVHSKGPKALGHSLKAKGYQTGVQQKVNGINKKGVKGLRIRPLE